MPIEFLCTGCGQTVRAPDVAAGKAGKCPNCGGLQTIPLLQEPSAPASRVVADDPPNAARPPDATMPPADPQAVVEGPASAPETTWCLGCGRQVEAGATRCPNCGEPMPLMTYEDHPLAHQVVAEWLAIDHATQFRCIGCERRISLASLPTPTLKCPFCGVIPSRGICQALLRAIGGRRKREIASPTRTRAEKKAAAMLAAMKDGPKRQGECSRCGRSRCSLRETEDKQWACLPCFSKDFPALASGSCIWLLRSAGVNTPDDLAEKEGERLWVLHSLRKLGLSLPDDAPLAELLHMDAKELVSRRLQTVFGGKHPWRTGQEIEAWRIREIEGQDSLPPVFHFYEKVVGVTFTNDDGTDRQEILSTCSPLQTLRLEHEDNNPQDSNAIRVCTEDGRQIGHLFRGVASNVWRQMQRNFTFAAISLDISGGTKNRPTLGMNILLLVGQPGVSQQEIQTYLVSIMPAVAVDVYDYYCYWDYNDDDDDEEEEEREDDEGEDDSDDDSVVE